MKIASSLLVLATAFTLAACEKSSTDTANPDDANATPPATEETPPAEETPSAEAPAADNGDDAAERLVAMKLAVEGKDPAAIEAELIERFGPGDRSELLREVVSRAAR